MVIGFQKMSEISSAESQERMGRGADIQWESPSEHDAAYYAMHARAHMAKYGTTSEDLALIRVKASTYVKLMRRRFTGKPSLPRCSRIRKALWPTGGKPTSRRGLLRQRGWEFLHHCGKRRKSESLFEETGVDFGHRCGFRSCEHGRPGSLLRPECG